MLHSSKEIAMSAPMNEVPALFNVCTEISPFSLSEFAEYYLAAQSNETKYD